MKTRKTQTNENRILVWDIPNRIFHWAFAASITGAIFIAFFVDDDRPIFQMHMLLGIVAMFLLIARFVMGVVGSRYSRFSSYPVHPREVITYMLSAVTSKTKLYAGNNPGSAVVALLMFALVPALFLTGAGYVGEPGEDPHELLAWALIAVVSLHLAGLAWHTIRHRENISLAMVTGRKVGCPDDAISSSHPYWAVVFFVASALWVGALFANHNAKKGIVQLPLIGVRLQLDEK